MRAVGSPQLDVCSEFDHVFWMGDLNYRCAPPISRPAGSGRSQRWGRGAGTDTGTAEVGETPVGQLVFGGETPRGGLQAD
eukprot:1159518-Prymnesium_polylepis.1